MVFSSSSIVFCPKYLLKYACWYGTYIDSCRQAVAYITVAITMADADMQYMKKEKIKNTKNKNGK